MILILFCILNSGTRWCSSSTLASRAKGHGFDPQTGCHITHIGLSNIEIAKKPKLKT